MGGTVVPLGERLAARRILAGGGMRGGTSGRHPCQPVRKTDEGRARSVERGGPAGVGPSQLFESAEKDRFRRGRRTLGGFIHGSHRTLLKKVGQRESCDDVPMKARSGQVGDLLV